MLTLICGHSRAGKTTYSKRFENVIHLDDTHSTQRVIEKVKKADDDIVVEGIYYQPRQRMELIRAYKGKTRCIFLDTPQEIREQRMGHKIHDYPFKEPSLDEGWDEIIILKEAQDVG